MTLLVGHRGAKGEAPENTLGGFVHAWRLGLRAVELDIRLTADKALAVIHDATLKRTCQAHGNIARIHSHQLKNLNAAAYFRRKGAFEPIPLLTEVFTAAPPDAFFQLEVKTDTQHRQIICEKLMEIIHAFKKENHVYVTSFDLDTLKIIQQLAPHIGRCWILEKLATHWLDHLLKIEATGVCLNHKIITHKRVQMLHDHHLNLTAWTVNSIKTFQRLQSWGVDYIISDYPSKLQDWSGASHS